mgnify:CR=1 FL=1
MRIKEIEARLAAIKQEIEQRGDAMTAEITIIGRLDHSLVFFMTSRPSMSGSPKSSKTKSGSEDVIIVSPSFPLCAALTLY